MLMSRESSSSRAEQIAQQLLIYGREVPVEEILEKIAAVTVGDIERVARRVLATAPTVTALGPLKPLESPERIAARRRGAGGGGARPFKVFAGENPQADSLLGPRLYLLPPRIAAGARRAA